MFPIHPAIVHFPIALLVLSVIADFLGCIKNNDALRATGRWSLLGALIGGAVAIPAGLFDWYRQTLSSEAQEHVQLHMMVGLILFAVIIGLNIWRWFFINRDSKRGGLGWAYLIAGVLALGLTFYQGYLGHELVVDHGIGVKSGGYGKTPSSGTKEHEHSLSRLRGVPA